MSKYLFLAPKLPVPDSPLLPETFEEIKCLAGKTWTQHTQEYGHGSTSYAAAFGNKRLDAAIRGRISPPPLLPEYTNLIHQKYFLVNQLHNLPGHYGSRKGIHPNFVEDSSVMKKFQVRPKKLLEMEK